jgi:hypothetical protein
MYSPLIVDKNLYALKKAGEYFIRRPVEDCIEIATALESRTPPYTPREQEFMRSEIILCREDFRYWADRYGWVERDSADGGGYGVAEFWPSQERALRIIGRRQEENAESMAKHGFSPGIFGVWHKTRQQGATALLRLISGHRLTMWKHTRAIAASLDETKVQELYKRDHIWLDNLPSFLRPKVQFDVKNSHISFAHIKSALSYQQANQEAGVGTGQQFDVAHMSEVALWAIGWRLEFDFLPAVSKTSQDTFVAFESTADGRGEFNFWHQFTENIRKRIEGYEYWIYVFTPWYLNTKKNRLPAPDGWQPNIVTQEHAELVAKTSGNLVGETVRLHSNQLYWWESEWKRNKEQATLNMFFTNYPATPEQSFQHHNMSALPLETIEWMRAKNTKPQFYNPQDLPMRA